VSVPGPGEIIDLWDGGEIVTGVAVAEEKGRIRVVTEKGEEIRITGSRVAHRPGAISGTDRRAATQAAARHAEEARRLAGSVDVVSLWELLVDGGGRHSIRDLTAIAFGRNVEHASSALIRRLSGERTYFERKGDLWEAKGRASVEETRKRLAAVEAKARRRAAFVSRARARMADPRTDPADRPGAGPPTLDDEDADLVSSLIDLALRGDESSHRKEALSLLDDLGIAGPAPSAKPTPHLAAFQALVRLGVFLPDENLEIRRFNLAREFPIDVQVAAVSAASKEIDGSRRDLTSLPVFTVDDEDTVEIDDAISWEEIGDGRVRLGVHIADPAQFVAVGDPVDQEALKRAATYYFPDERLPMIPAAISEGAASLAPGAPRPALSFLVTLDGSGTIVSSEIVSSIIRSRRRLTYEVVDDWLADRAAGEGSVDPAPALKSLDRLAAKLEEDRIKAGAVRIRAPEVMVKVARDGTIHVTRIDERGPARRLISEMMILANHVAARFCAENRIPAIFRRQPPPDRRPEPIPEGPYDPVAVRSLRRSMRRGESSLAPDLHFGLGLPMYLQVTSPLRRYQDLAVQRQIEAFLAGSPLPYSSEHLARIAATTDEAERSARLAEAGVDLYFILKHLASRKGETIEGVIVSVEPRRTEVELSETLNSAWIEPRSDHVLGGRIRLVVETARPREGVLRLRQVEPGA
jgi:exoribonuclease-2